MTTVIRQDDLIESVADALQYISYYHPIDFIQALNDAYEKEANPAAKDAMAQILINSRMCAEGHRPICQDTGIVTVFLSVGMDIQWQGDMSVTDMVNEGVRRAYMNPDNKLRASIMDDPDGVEGRIFLAELYGFQGYTRRALAYYGEVLRMSGERPDIRMKVDSLTSLLQVPGR